MKTQLKKFKRMCEEHKKYFSERRSKELFDLLFDQPFSNSIDIKEISIKLIIPMNFAQKIFNYLIEYKVFIIDEEVLQQVEDDPELFSLYFLTTGYIPVEVQKEIKQTRKQNIKEFNKISF